MEGKTNWKPNEQGGDSLANNANEWRSQHDPGLRNRVIAKIVEKLKEYYPKRYTDERENEIYNSAVKFEENTYAKAKNKDDYLRKLSEKMHSMEKLTSVNATITPYQAQVVNQSQSLPTSLPYAQTPRSKQWLPQNTQSNLNISVRQAQNVNIHISEGVQVNLVPDTQRRQQLHPQQQPQNSNNIFKNQMNQQFLKEKIRHGNLRPTHIQQQSQSPQQPLQQSFHQSGQQNSQFLSRNQFSTQLVRSSYQQQMAMTSSQEQKKQEQDRIFKDAQQRQNNEEQHGAFRVSSSQQNNNVRYQALAQQNTHQQRFNASAFASLQVQNMSDSGQSGNFNVPRSSFLGTHQGQEMGQTQPMMLQQYQTQHHPAHQPQNRSLQQHLDPGHNDTQMFQATSSLCQTQNITDQQIQQYQFERAPIANPSNFTRKTVNVHSGNWQEETYLKIKALKEKYLHILSGMHQKFTDKLRQAESLRQPEHIEKLKVAKVLFARIIVFLNVERNLISEKHRELFDQFEGQILRYTKHHQTELQRPMQIHHQVHVAQSLEKDQLNSRLMQSNQNVASSTVPMPHLLHTRPKMEPRDDNNITASSGNVVLPSLNQNPVSDPQVQSSTLQQTKRIPFHPRKTLKQTLHRQQEQEERKENPQLQIPTSNQTNEMNDVRMKQGINIKAELLQQHLLSSPHQLLKPMASSGRMFNFSPLPSSPQIVDQQILPATVNQTGTPSQSGGSPFVAPSAVTSFAPSPVPGDPEKPIPIQSQVSQYPLKINSNSPVELGTKKQPPQVSLSPELIAERPIYRLIKACQSLSPENLAESVREIRAVVNMVDRIAGSFHPGALGEDLSATTRFDLSTHGETNPTKRMKRTITALPQDIAPQTNTYEQFTASSSSKVNKIEPRFSLRHEINEINKRLIETVVEISNEVTSGTIVSCSYYPVAFSATYKAHYMSGKISQIQPLRVLVPANYPNCSPILIDEISFDESVHITEDLSARTSLRFRLSMKELPEPVSLKDMAQMWNDCARAVMAEYAERHGGGTFSSKYGAWETVLGAS